VLFTTAANLLVWQFILQRRAQPCCLCIFYRCMLSNRIETKHLDWFKQALYYLETFDIQGRKWVIDKDNIIRVTKRNSNTIDRETSWGELGYIDDWFIERVEVKPGNWTPSLSTLKSPYRKRRKPITSLYLIGHRKGGKAITTRPRGPWLRKRRRLSTLNPWTGFIKSYLEIRRVKRVLESPRYDPTDQDVEYILLASAQFVQTRAAQIEEKSDRVYTNKKEYW
jgi:hypothetical protein